MRLELTRVGLLVELANHYTTTGALCDLSITQTASDGEAQVLEIWGVWNIPSLTFIPSPLLFGVVVPVRVPSMGVK